MTHRLANRPVLARFPALVLLACLPAQPLFADSLWSAAGNVLRLQASGISRTLTVETPSEAVGLGPGAVVFRGTRSGNRYAGRLQGFGCPQGGVEVEGRVPDELTVVLKPVGGAGCAGLAGGALTLRFLGKADGAPVVVAPAAAEEVAAPAQDPAPATVAPAEDPAPAAAAPAAAPQQAEAPAQPAVTPEPAPAAPPATVAVPTGACASGGVAKSVSLAACQGVMAGLRIASGADLQAEAARHALFAGGQGVADLYRAVDAACYGAAALGSYDAGLALAASNPQAAQGLRPLCLEMAAVAQSLPVAVRMGLSGGYGAISSAVWTRAGEGGACKGKQVLRITPAGLFEGRYGAERAVPHAVISQWADDGQTLSAELAIHSELLTAPDVTLSITGQVRDGVLDLTIIRQVVTPETRYSNDPVYKGVRIVERYVACTP